jgi:hypothetical protein
MEIIKTAADLTGTFAAATPHLTFCKRFEFLEI